MLSHRENHLALRAMLLSVVGLPAQRAWENVGPFQPTTGVPYVDESYAPATSTLRGQYDRGSVETRGLYIVHWFGLLNTDIAEIRDGADAVLAAFRPGHSVFLPESNATLRIRGDQAPYPGPITVLDTGFAVCRITIPWLVESINSA